jgi:hypothetical protein
MWSSVVLLPYLKNFNMKKIKLTLAALAISTAALFSFNSFQSTSIKGTVTPPEQALNAWAFNATDTFRVAVQNGAFEIIDVKAGTYTLTIEAQEPFANATKNDVVVTDGQTTDVGEIVLQPK